jgi:histidine phosphotransferase ChpT
MSSYLMPQSNPFDQSTAKSSSAAQGEVCDDATSVDQASDLDLVALLGSRLCHDLISPMGAIGNGVELLAMSGDAMSPELELIAQSVNAANARLKFFRVAFGQAAPDQRLGATEVRNLLRDMAATGRLAYDWQPLGDQSRQMVKLCFLALLCAETAMPWGGTVRMREDSGQWFIEGETKKTKGNPDIWSVLQGSAQDVSPAQIQFALLPKEAARYGKSIAWHMEETTLRITF